MGNKPSSPPPPPPPPVVKEADFPGSSPPTKSVIPGKPENPRTQGVSISEAQTCKQCDLEFTPGISTSSVNLTRTFGAVRTCSKFDTDLQKVKNKQMAVRDFVGGIQGGQYLRPLSDGFCEEVRFPDEVVQKIATLDDLNNNVDKLTSARIRQISSEGFSADTKAVVKPSIPLNMSFNGTPFSVDTITVYHPAPLRVQDQQADAVISLNDPSAGESPYIVLIPIVSGNPSTPSAEFFGKIANQLSSVELPNPATGQYGTTDIQTGKNWGLSNLFPITGVQSGKSKVDAGFFVWEGLPPFEKYLAIDTPSLKQYGWRRKEGVKPVTYIMLEKPLPVSPNDLAALIRSLPVTDWKEAIHEVFSAGKGVVYKQGPATACAIPTREHMENNHMITEESCDPFSAINVPDKGFSTEKILTLVFNVVLALAAAIGAYIALAAVARMYDVEYSDFAKGAGKVMGVWAKNFGGKVGALAVGPRALAALSNGSTPITSALAGLPTSTAGIANALPAALPSSLTNAAQTALPRGMLTDTAVPTLPPGIPRGLLTNPSFGAVTPTRSAVPAPSTSSAMIADALPSPISAVTDTIAASPTPMPAPSPVPAPSATRRVSPGIAARMKNYDSNASVTPTGQATRGLFNTARTFGRGRTINGGRGGSTRRDRR